jgi:hypothetical protein
MDAIGVDLHKKIITVCVVDENLRPVAQKTFYCQGPDEIVEFCRFASIAEATS